MIDAGVRGERADQRHAEAVIAIEVGEADDLVILAERQRPELGRLPGEAVVDDRNDVIAAVAGRQAEGTARIEPADLLGGAEALGQPGVVEVARQPEPRIERIPRRQRRIGSREGDTRPEPQASRLAGASPPATSTLDASK